MKSSSKEAVDFDLGYDTFEGVKNKCWKRPNVTGVVQSSE